MLQNAAKATSKLFKELKQEQVKKNDINVLLATQELELFAVKYGEVHFEANESKVISKEHYGEKNSEHSNNLLNSPNLSPSKQPGNL